MEKTTNVRNSSIELLRMISLFMILCLHANKDMVLVNDFAVTKYNDILISVIESLSIVAVNCFILITGYFSITSNKLKVRKIVDLIFLVCFYGVAIYVVLILTGFESFSIKQFIKCAVPFFFDKIWFVNVYLVLYLLTPFINKLLRALTKKQYLILLSILLLLFSVWPSFLPNPPSTDEGYGIISFVLIYTIGGYLRLHFNRNLKPATYLAGYIFLSAVTSLLFFFRGSKWLNYNSIGVILASVMVFMFFKHFNFKSKMINYLSVSTIAIFIIHAHQCIRPHLFTELFGLQNHLMDVTFILHYAICIVVIFVSCILIDLIRRLVFKFTVDKVFDKIKLLNSVVEL